MASVPQLLTYTFTGTVEVVSPPILHVAGSRGACPGHYRNSRDASWSVVAAPKRRVPPCLGRRVLMFQQVGPRRTFPNCLDAPAKQQSVCRSSEMAADYGRADPVLQLCPVRSYWKHAKEHTFSQRCQCCQFARNSPLPLILNLPPGFNIPHAL